MFRGRVIAPGEPEWLDSDRDHALAWMVDEKARLACGCYPDETVGPEHDDRFSAEMVVCERHRAVGEAAERWSKSSNEADVRHGILWRATRDPDE